MKALFDFSLLAKRKEELQLSVVASPDFSDERVLAVGCFLGCSGHCDGTCQGSCDSSCEGGCSGCGKS